MNKKLLITLVVILLLVAGALTAKTFVAPKTSPTSTNTVLEDNTNTQPIEQSSKVSGSIFDLINLNKPLQCNYSGSNISGTTYINGTQIRGDYTLIQEESAISGHMISDGEYMYTWTDSLPQGMKIKITEVTAPQAPDKPDYTTLDTFKNSYDFECDAWEVNTNIFDIPSNITFSDFSTVLENTGNSMCQACNYIQDAEAKLTCLQSFKCN